jgi:hypothetical protein
LSQAPQRRSFDKAVRLSESLTLMFPAKTYGGRAGYARALTRVNLGLVLEAGLWLLARPNKAKLNPARRGSTAGWLWGKIRGKEKRRS